MPRDHARILTAIWADDDFRRLPSDAQRLYMLLLTQPELTYAGGLDLRVSRWAACAPDTTPQSVRRALDALAATRFVVVDDTTEEVLVRSYLRVNEVWKQPKLLTLALRQIGPIQSRRLRHTMRLELLRLPDDKRADGARDLARTLPDTPGDTPPDTPSGTHADTPAERLPDTPTRAPERGRNQEPGTMNQERGLAVETSRGRVTEVDARESEEPPTPLEDLDEPPLCRRHEGWDRDDVPACRGCARLREKWEAALLEAAKPPPKPPWCGDCDPHTRLVEIDDRTVAHCRACHPTVMARAS